VRSNTVNAGTSKGAQPGFKEIARQWWIVVLGVGLALALGLADRSRGAKIVDTTLYSLKEMALVLPPIFIILGLLDVWVPREKMVRFMGEGSGVKGVLLAFLLGAAAAGPLYGAFPVAQVLLRKGASVRNVTILLGSWSTLKIPMLLFELTSMGPRFTLTRMAVDVVGVLLIALLLDRFMTTKDREEIIAKANAA
jgi:uncharacterized membrane protein YraQ (UPF0718 family)